MNIVFEGHSYSGKTTLLNYLRDKENKNVIAEHDVYAGGIDNYPPFPPITFQMAKNNVDFFADIEVNRAEDAKRYEKEAVFFDRSFISVILFQKFMKLLSIPGQFEAYDYAKELFRCLLEEGKIAFPDLLVLITCKSEEDYSKRQSREISVGLLRSKEAMVFFAREYEQISSIFDKYGRLQKVTSTNGVQSLRESATTINNLYLTNITTNQKKQLVIDVMEAI